MNYGLIPVSVCETLCRESRNWGKTVVGSGSLPFLIISVCYVIGYCSFSGYY